MREKLLYRSTNRNLNTPTISGFRDTVTFEEALFMGQAPDEGLFMPERIPSMSPQEISGLRSRPYHEVAFEILRRFLSQEVDDAVLRSVTEKACNFEIPIEKLEDDIHIIRLDRGPTASFKDFAARVMARLMQRLKPVREEMAILVATSGDTGSAVGEACAGLDGMRVIILYPELEVSPLQKKHLDTIGGNAYSVAVSGTFDDCQRLVKEASGDPALAALHLTSANSINIGRILPQITYYFYACVNTARDGQPVVFSVPSGNLGNSLGCEIARRMGMPVKKLVIGTNANDEVPEFLRTGVYRALQPSRACLSNAMNVGNPSNLARFFDLYGGTVDKEGEVHVQPDIAEMRRRIYSVSVNDEETISTMKDVYDRHGVVLEPHGAVGVAALRRYFRENERCLSICLETASPAKFPEVMDKTLGITPEVPSSLARIAGRTGEPYRLPPQYQDFKHYLLGLI
jgi:threonine synthase